MSLSLCGGAGDHRLLRACCTGFSSAFGRSFTLSDVAASAEALALGAALAVALAEGAALAVAAAVGFGAADGSLPAAATRDGSSTTTWRAAR